MGAPWLRAMARVFDGAGTPLYLVGGAVRNPLMGLPLSDIDVCGPARPEAVCALCEGTEVRAHLRAAHFGTVELHLTDEDGARHMAEYTTFREDSYRCGHRPESVRFTTDIAVDALRRDFSVNALYRRVHADGLEAVIDPTGGQKALRDGSLHTVTDDPDRVLRDDGLRILRAARFQAELDLVPTSALENSLKRYAPLLGDIACERLRDELGKVIMADSRYLELPRRAPATLSGLETIVRIGAWPYLFPTISFDREAAYALSRLSAPLPIRIALLLRRAAPEDAQAALRRMRFSEKDVAFTVRCIRAVQGAAAGTLAPFDAVRLGMDAVFAARDILAAVKDADAALAVRSLLSRLEARPATLRELAVNGDDLKPFMEARGLPLRGMGALLEALWRMAVEGTVRNERDALIRAAQDGMDGETR